MNKISVVVVDDEKVDRYIVKRRMAKMDAFGDVIEATNGDRFLDEYFQTDQEFKDGVPPPLLILMDVNMPGRNGFETVEEIQRRMTEGRGPESIVIMMFTSSDNSNDRARAETLDAVKGYITKPLDEKGIETILALYETQ